MIVKEFYEVIGGEYESIIARLRSDELVKRFLLKFLKEPSYQQLLEAVEQGNTKDAFVAAHTLKGVAANLSLKELHRAVDILTEQLRTGTDKPDEVLFHCVKECYENVITNIEKL